MPKRRFLIAANWKMNPAPDALDAYKTADSVDTVVFPTALDIPTCLSAGIVTGAQFGHPEDTGAFTGDVSMKMIKDTGCTHVLCGHSERRQYHSESNAFVAAQVASAITHNLTPILCIGETDEERKAGKEKDIVKEQIEAVIEKLNTENSMENGKWQMEIAYEPVWAIGTGNTATPKDAQEMHAFIRSLLPGDVREQTRILYGGSMKPENAEELLNQPDIDGGLVGGASLVPEKFAEIVAITTTLS